MENLLKEPGELSLGRDLYMRLAKRFNCCKDRAGKPAIKWAEVQTWFLSRQQPIKLQNGVSVKLAEKLSAVPESCSNKALQICVTSEGGMVPDLSKLEFEARSATDGAWYDVQTFLTYRLLSSGESEARVRYAGFGAEDDEWVNVKKNIRERSLPIEHSECGKLKVGDLVVCFQESGEMARYFDAHILGIQQKMHDIRGCRCLFLIRYDHDSTEERVQLKRLCCRPS